MSGTEEVKVHVHMEGTCWDEGMSTHQGEHKGYRGACTQGWRCGHALTGDVCVHIVGGGTEVCMSPNGTSSPPDCTGFVLHHTRSCLGAPACAWLPRSCLPPPHGSFARQRFLIPTQRLPVLGLTPLPPTARGDPHTAASLQHPGVWECLFLGLLQSQPGAVWAPSTPSTAGHPWSRAPVPVALQTHLWREFISLSTTFLICTLFST